MLLAGWFMRLGHSLFVHPALFAVSLSVLTVACGGSSEVQASRQLGAIGVITGGVGFAWAVYGEASAPRCGFEEFGACTFFEPCPIDEPTPVTPTARAGTVTVQGTPLVLDALGQSYSGTVGTPIEPGDTVEMSANGSEEVPAHSGSVLVPRPTTVLAPSLGEGVSIDRSEDLEVSWTPVADGHVGVSVSVAVSAAELASVICSADASHGHLTVPARALARLPPTDPAVDRTGYLSVSQGDQVKVQPSGWDIWLVVNQSGEGAVAEIF